MAVVTTSFGPSQPAVETAVAEAPPRPLIGVRVSAFSLSVTDSGLPSGVRIVTLSAACVMVNSNGFACPLFGFWGRQVPDRFGGACAARPITTTAAASTIVNTVRFMSAPSVWRALRFDLLGRGDPWGAHGMPQLAEHAPQVARPPGAQAVEVGVHNRRDEQRQQQAEQLPADDRDRHRRSRARSR